MAVERVGWRRILTSRWLTETCDITDPSASVAGVIMAGVRCRLSPSTMAPARRLFGDDLALQAHYLLLLPAGTAITEGHMVTVAGQDYDVLSVAPAASAQSEVQALIWKRTPAL